MHRLPKSGSTLLACLLWLAGCTTIHVAEDPVHEAPAGPTGTAIVSLTANTAEVRQFDSITVQRVQDPAHRNPLVEHQSVLVNILPGVSRDNSLFVGALAAGDYELHELASRGRVLTLSGGVLGSFHIDAGQVTDLGRLVLTAVNERGLVGRSTTITGNQDFVRRFAPDHLSLYRSPAAHGWSSPRSDADKAEQYARAHPLGTLGFRRLANGELIGGSRMGLLLVRGADGHWRTALTGELEAITAVAPYQTDGNLAVAGGDLGSLLRLRDNGVIVAVDRGNLPAGGIFFLDSSADHAHWIVGLQQAGRAAFYTADALDRGSWRELASLVLDSSFWTGPPQVWAWTMPDGFGFAGSSSSAVSCFDYRSGTWRRGHSPGDRVLHAITASERGDLGVLTQARPDQAGAFSAMHWSADCGANWSEIALPPRVDPGPPLRLSDGAVLEPATDDKGWGLYLTRDDGKRWSKQSGEPILDERLWSFGPLLLAVSRRHGAEEVRVSKDSGATWSTELSSVEQTLLDRQQAGQGSGR